MDLRRASARLGAAAASLALAGCALGAGPTPGRVTLTVTSGFGARAISAAQPLRLRGEETVMSALMRNYSVSTRYAGGFVESINGQSGGESHGGRSDWFYFVNGIEAEKGAAATKVHAGDAIWWDLHDWSATEEVPAVVGSFPEPFLNGTQGKRLPVRVECAEVTAAACRTVLSRLGSLGVPAGLAGLSAAGETPATLRVAVGPWTSMRKLLAASAIERGPRASGVYAQMAPDGGSMALLDAGGHVTRTLSAGAGLVAAVRYSGEEPLWLVTGTDNAGVGLAARAFDRAALANHFAVAIDPGDEVLPLPEGE
jgi:hypothetical protein